MDIGAEFSIGSFEHTVASEVMDPNHSKVIKAVHRCDLVCYGELVVLVRAQVRALVDLDCESDVRVCNVMG